MDLVQPLFGRGVGPFRNLNRTLGPTRPFLSFTPCSGHGVNDTTPSQKPLCQGMPSFSFRTPEKRASSGPDPATFWTRCRAFGATLAVLTARTRTRPISLPTRQQKRPFSGKTLPCRYPKRPYRQSECQHGKIIPGLQTNGHRELLNQLNC